MKKTSNWTIYSGKDVVRNQKTPGSIMVLSEIKKLLCADHCIGSMTSMNYHSSMRLIKKTRQQVQDLDQQQVD